MSRVRAFLAFWWDFVVGDDWRLATGVAGGLGLTALASRSTGAGWILLLVTVSAVLILSVRRVVALAARDDGPPRDGGQPHDDELLS
jgi:hypothetical protein